MRSTIFRPARAALLTSSSTWSGASSNIAGRDGGTHFEALQLLSRQPRLCWFFGDQTHWILHSQQHPLDSAQHEGFDALLRDAVRHDTMVRMSRRYDAQAALAEIVKHYELRAGTRSGGYQPAGPPH